METENGAVVYKTSGSQFVDFIFNVMKYRNEDILISDLNQMFNNNPILTTALTLFVRDRVKGMGERKIGREMSKFLVNKLNAAKAKKLIDTLISLGRWDDVLYLDKVPYDMIISQLKEDSTAEHPSLLAKWMPSINAGFASRKMALKLAKKMGLNAKEYRKLLSIIRQKLNLVETNMVNKTYENIDYSHVPSQAMRKHKDAFNKNDHDRFVEYLKAVNTGEVKINTSTSNPVEVVRSYVDHDCWYDHKIKPYDQALETIWKNLPVHEVANLLVVRDGSGSMEGTPMDVGDALTIYTSEHSYTPAFKDKFIEFSSESRVVDLSGCETLHDKLHLLRTKYTDCSNTNLEAVFDQVLDTAIRFNLKQEEIPSLLIISDMQFDAAVDGWWFRDRDTSKTRILFSTLKEKYEDKGYKMPKLIFWNVQSDSSNDCIPVQENDLGVILVSGYSQNILDMVMSGETDPFNALVDTLVKKEYVSIAKAILA